MERLAELYGNPNAILAEKGCSIPIGTKVKILPLSNLDEECFEGKVVSASNKRKGTRIRIVKNGRVHFVHMKKYDILVKW